MSGENELMSLDVYCVFDFNTEIDYDFVHKYLNTYLNINLRNVYNVNNVIIKQNSIDKGDILKRGVSNFRKLWDNLKLKNTNDTWFMYLSNGNIDGHKNVFLMLLNKNPGKFECNYCINKQHLDIITNMDKHTKLNNMNVLSNTLNKILSSNKLLQYNHIPEYEN